MIQNKDDVEKLASGKQFLIVKAFNQFVLIYLLHILFTTDGNKCPKNSNQ